MSENKAVAACLITDKPVKKTPYQVKGVFMKNFSSYNVVPMLNGEFRNRYLYPRVQVKVINEKIFIIGIGYAYDQFLQLKDNIWRAFDLVVDDREQAAHSGETQYVAVSYTHLTLPTILLV